MSEDRGYSFAAVLADEIAFWYDENSANPDEEIIVAASFIRGRGRAGTTSKCTQPHESSAYRSVDRPAAPVARSSGNHGHQSLD
jgi:hypothetical protein